MKKFLCLLYCVILVIGCNNSNNENLSITGEFLPSASNLSKGLVYKYYTHRQPVDRRDQKKTDILYKEMKLKNDTLEIKDYNAACRLNRIQKLKIDANKWIQIDEKVLDYSHKNKSWFEVNSFTIDSMKNISMDWNEQTSDIHKSILNKEYFSNYKNRQNSQKDTLIDGLRHKVFYGTFNADVIYEKDTTSYNYTNKSIFREKLGMTSYFSTSKDIVVEYELVEVMSNEDFEVLANHGTHRVGYIDTSNTLDDASTFEPCFHASKINDYYNDRRAQFIGSTGALRKLLNDNIDNEMFQNENGYLTFRFVVNCEGEAGWFTADGSTFDYKDKSFSKILILSILNILDMPNSWRNLTIREKARDAYTYIILKIENGEITEIIP